MAETESNPEVNANDWKWLATPPGEPAWNMAFDERMLINASLLRTPLVRFYQWTEACATFGYFQKYKWIINNTELRPVIRRLTGGGIVPHQMDWTYSVAIPPTHPHYRLKARESYCEIHRLIKRSLAKLGLQSDLAEMPDQNSKGLCFAHAEENDVLAGGVKIAGAAQRRNKFGLLIQGSIQPPESMHPRREDWIKAFLGTANDNWNVTWALWDPDRVFLESVSQLTEEKYSQNEYNQKR